MNDGVRAAEKVTERVSGAFAAPEPTQDQWMWILAEARGRRFDLPKERRWATHLTLAVALGLALVFGLRPLLRLGSPAPEPYSAGVTSSAPNADTMYAGDAPIVDEASLRQVAEPVRSTAAFADRFGTALEVPREAFGAEVRDMWLSLPGEPESFFLVRYHNGLLLRVRAMPSPAAARAYVDGLRDSAAGGAAEVRVEGRFVMDAVFPSRGDGDPAEVVAAVRLTPR